MTDTEKEEFEEYKKQKASEVLSEESQEEESNINTEGILNYLNKNRSFFGGFLPFGSMVQLFTITDVLLYALSLRILHIP